MENNILPLIKDFRPSKFVIQMVIHEGWLLYNTISASIIYIKNKDELYKSFDELKNMYYYVPLTFDEFAFVDKIRIRKENIAKEKCINGFTILTTLHCNARCYYCYEKGTPHISMTDKTANDVANYIMKFCSKKTLNIRWFGGEPLINTKVIDIICNKLNDNNIVFDSSMVSNGLLFDDSTILKAKNIWKMKRVQITLDGTKDLYQKAKAYKYTNGNEFDKVIINIKKLLQQKIHVSIRLNQNIHNTSDLLDLVDFLVTEFKECKNLSVYNSWLYDEKEEGNTIIEKEYYKNFKKLQDKIVECGLYSNDILKRKLRLHHCMADNDSSVLITPNGKLGKCEHYTNDHLIGTIYDSNYDEIEISKWKEKYQPIKKCFDCPLYPQCLRIKLCPEERRYCSLTQCENKIELIKSALIKKFLSSEAYNQQ